MKKKIKKPRRKNPPLGNVNQSNITNSQVNVGSGNKNKQVTKAVKTTSEKLPETGSSTSGSQPATPKWVKFLLNGMVVLLAGLTLCFIYRWMQAESSSWEPLVSMVSTVMTFLVMYISWRYKS